MQRIVFLNRFFDPDQSATSQLLTDLARGLAQSGMEVHVICSRQRFDNPRAHLAIEEELDGVHVHRVSTTRFGRGHLPGRAVDYLSFYVACTVKLLHVMRRDDVLIAKTDPPMLSIVAAPIAKAKCAALINWQQDIFPEIASRLGANPLPRFLDGLLRRLRDHSLRAAEMNVLIGERMREYLTERGVPASKLCVIENWADGYGIRPKATSDSELRTRLGLMQNFVVCYSGNLGRAHDLETLLGAAAILKEDARFVFLITGSGAKMDALKRGVELRTLRNFHFLPHQPREALEDSLAAGDVHLVTLFPALEGLIVPSKLYGIMAAGRPLIFIGDPDGEIGRVVQRVNCGKTVSVGDSKALVDALLNLFAEPDARQAMGTRARASFNENFSRKRALERWLGLIDSIVKRRRERTVA